MPTAVIALLSFLAFFVAYHTYGRFLSRKIFRLDPDAVVPSREVNDGKDYVPTRKNVLFGHHFTSIAGTGPIVGPALAVFWGWLPALLWVIFGCIFIGAVHDLGALVVSLRSRGMTIGDVAGRMMNGRARVLFLLVLFFALMLVIGIFGLVIALIFSMYPGSVLSVWVAMPLAVIIGLWIRRVSGSIAVPTVVALLVLYASVALGVYVLPIDLGALLGMENLATAEMGFLGGLRTTVVVWTGLLLVYCFAASVLPVWLLLQPRDYINSFQLYVALILLMGGLLWAHPPMVAPAVQRTAVHVVEVNADTAESQSVLSSAGFTVPAGGSAARLEATGEELAALTAGGVAYREVDLRSKFGPKDAPPILPFLFITIACGAVSGFHSLVSSGTSSKQMRSETDAHFVGYGAMLLEGGLAVLVILACCAGLGMGHGSLSGVEAWRDVYHGSWEKVGGLGSTVGAFVEGSVNMLASIGIPFELATGVMAVMVACFAATTLDTATRLQRYIIQELGGALRVSPMRNKFVATTVAVATGGALALIPSTAGGPGTGGKILWPLFGSTNQLLAGMALLVVAFYLIRHRRPAWFLALPLAFMVVLPAWALTLQLQSFWAKSDYILVAIGMLLLGLQAWIVLEGALLWRRARGVLPEPLPPLHAIPAGPEVDGSSCC
jgi:carbon starvation protein